MENLISHFSFLISKRGQAALSLVLLIGGIMILIGVTLSFIVLSFINASYGFQAANRALAVASAGAHDALIKLVRDKGFSAGTPYTVTVGNDPAQVTVENPPLSGQATIISSATVSGRQRKIKVVIAIDHTRFQVNMISWEELAL